MKRSRARCECEKSGTVRSSVYGIIAGPPDNEGGRYIERCDLCLQFESDGIAGLEYTRTMGGSCRYDEQQRTHWSPT